MAGVLLALSMPLRAQDRAPQFRHYTVADGLASTTVYSMMQDSKGYLWLCTEAGVNRFSGHFFETFNVGNGLSDNENFKCFEDSKGRIWLAAYNGRLCYYKDEKFFTEAEDTSLHHATNAGKYLKHFEEDKSGNIWFSTFQGGIFKYDGKKVASAGNPYQAAVSPVLFRLEGQTYTIVAAQNANILRSPESGTVVTLKRKRGAVNITDMVVLPGRDTAITFITDDGIESLVRDSIITEISRQQLHCKISCACLVGADLWIGSYRNGVIRIKDYVHKGSDGAREHFLGQASVSEIITDSEDGIWISTLSDGVYYLPRTQSYITNIPAPSVTSLRHNPDNSVWAAGTYYGEVLTFHNDRLISRYRNRSYPDTRIKSLCWVSESKLVVGMDYLPYLYEVNRRKPGAILPSISGTSDLYPVTDGVLICARGAIYFLGKTGQTKTLFQNGVATAPVSYKLVSVAGTGAGNCWFANVSTVFHLDSSGIVRELAGPSLLGSNPIDLEFVNDELWVGTHGAGIFIFKDDKLRNHLTENTSRLTSNVCQKLMSDHRGNVWVGTNRGISIFDAATHQLKARLTLEDVLINNDIRDMDVYGRAAYIATPSGISIINTDRIIWSSSPPPLYITSLKANDSSYTGAGRRSIRYFKGTITLEFTAVTFQANQSLQYRYRAANGDTAWHLTGTGQVSFYNLAPGDYDFLIAAKKYNSDWSQPLRYGFTIMPRWYQSLPFKASCALLTAMIIFLLYRLQVARIRRREAEKTTYNKRIAELEGSALANQMNPHFIFNSLNTVQQFVLQKEERQVLDYLSGFSVLMRQMLQYSRSSLIDLDSEIDFLKRYLELEQTRFNGKFSYEIEVEKHLLDEGLKIPPMLIQPLLENAIKHGIPAKGGYISLNVSLHGDLLVCSVTDNGAGIDATQRTALPGEKGFESTALKVIESRIRLMGDKQHSAGELIILDRQLLRPPQNGTIATLKIPLKN